MRWLGHCCLHQAGLPLLLPSSWSVHSALLGDGLWLGGERVDVVLQQGQSVLGIPKV